MVRLFGPVLVLMVSLVALWSGDGNARADDKKTDATEAKKGDGSLKVEGTLDKDDPKDKLVKQSPSKSYEHKMKADGIYVIDLKSKAFDCVLRLEDPTGKQVAINDDVPNVETLDSRIVYKAPKGGTYKIIATNLDGKVGDFVLTVREGTQKDVEDYDPHFKFLNKPAPEIVGDHILNGKTKKLSELKGKVVLLDFWAVWCGPCIATFPHLRDLHKEHHEDGLEILGVTTYYQRFAFDKTTKTGIKQAEEKLTAAEEQDMLKNFAEHHKLKHQLMTVSQAEMKKVGPTYGVRGIPQVVLIDREGIVRMIKVGSGPDNAKAIHDEIHKLLNHKDKDK